MALALDPRYVVEVRTRSHVRPHGPSSLDMTAVYRRRRIAVAAMALVLTVAASTGIRSLASRGDGAAPVSAVTPGVTASGAVGPDVSGAFVVSDGVYVVQPGDTMWSIASSLTDGSIRSYVADLVELNGGASLDVGQLLVLPDR